MGVPFAMALHETCAIESMAIVAGQDQFDYPEKYNLQPDAMKAQLRSNPAEFEQLIADNASADWLWNFIMNSSSELDKAIYREPGFAKAYRHSLDEGFGQGGGNYARDLVNAGGSILWTHAREILQSLCR